MSAAPLTTASVRPAEGAAHDDSASADRPGSVPFTSAALVLRDFKKGEHQLHCLRLIPQCA